MKSLTSLLYVGMILGAVSALAPSPRQQPWTIDMCTEVTYPIGDGCPNGVPTGGAGYCAALSVAPDICCSSSPNHLSSPYTENFIQTTGLLSRMMRLHHLSITWHLYISPTNWTMCLVANCICMSCNAGRFGNVLTGRLQDWWLYWRYNNCISWREWPFLLWFCFCDLG